MIAKKTRILIVEDEALIAEEIAYNLRELGYFLSTPIRVKEISMAEEFSSSAISAHF